MARLYPKMAAGHHAVSGLAKETRISKRDEAHLIVIDRVARAVRDRI